LWVVVALTLTMLLCVLHLPWALEVFRFAPLQPMDLAIAALLGLLSSVWFEAIKGVRVWVGGSSTAKPRPPTGV
jgi:hypothetical protein